jgi:hypothetical protein
MKLKTGMFFPQERFLVQREHSFPPFKVDLPDTYLGSHKTEIVRWRWKWQNVDGEPITLVESLQNAIFNLYSAMKFY